MFIYCPYIMLDLLMKIYEMQLIVKCKRVKIINCIVKKLNIQISKIKLDVLILD